METALIGGGIGLVGGVLGGLLSGAYQHWRDRFYRPNLMVDHADSDAYKSDDGQAYIYIRVSVRNTGRSTAKGVRVFLTGVKEVHTGGSTTPAPFHDSVPLAWAGWSFEPRDVPRGVDFFVDIVKISKHEAGWFFCVDQKFVTARLNNYSGTYRFWLTATSDNAEPATRQVDVTYMGNWHDLRSVAVSRR